MDRLILFSAGTTFTLFFILHLFVLRISGSEKILNGLISSLIIVSFFHFTVNLYFFGLAVLSVSYFIFILAAVIYVWGFLGLVTTSLRIQFLTEIDKRGTRGITDAELLKKYNRDIIVKTRLARLANSGEIKETGGIYSYNQKYSYFYLHLFMLKLLNRLYKKSRYHY